jgi:hypothetical protein
MCLACYTSLSTRGYSNVKCERMLIISSAQSNGTTEEGQISELVNFVQLQNFGHFFQAVEPFFNIQKKRN